MTELALATPLTSPQREYLSAAFQIAETLLSVNDVLDFSKIEAGRPWGKPKNWRVCLET
ncbi:MAG: hypothetical protein QM790_13995 [Nibricoccus sp.]